MNLKNCLQKGEKECPTRPQKNTSFGIEIRMFGHKAASKQDVRHIKQKVELLKQAIIKERSDRQQSQQQLKAVTKKYLSTEQTLQKKQEKNENLLHESRQLKDILIREKQQIKNLEAELQQLTEKRRKGAPQQNRPAPGAISQNQEQGSQGWKSYLSSFWK